MAHSVLKLAPRAENHAPQQVPLSEIALTGVYEISKILTSAHRLEAGLASVVNVLSSFMQMRHGVIALLACLALWQSTVTNWLATIR